jgi:multiple sugar transport system ATP-binding protein
MNMLRATVAEDAGRLTAQGFAASVPAGLRGALKAHAGREVMLGVRPEHVGERGAQDWSNAAPVRGTAEIVETIGHEVIVHMRCRDDMIVAKLGAHRVPAFGEEIELVMNCDAVHLFDPATEQRIG